MIDRAASPIADPTSYPGQPVPGSCILTHDDCVPMSVAASGWTITDEGRTIDVDTALDRLGAAPIADRRPVLAIGSNASAAQLRRKWHNRVLVVPMTAARVEGIGVGYSAHVSRAGYVPYAPIAAPGRTAVYYALWLTDDQIEHLDATEPNYHPTPIDGTAFPALLESGQQLEQYMLYRGRWGVVTDSNGTPVPAASQAAALELLNELTATNADLGADADLRATASAHLAARATGDGLEHPPTL